jgi:hypothetical protein
VWLICAGARGAGYCCCGGKAQGWRRCGWAAWAAEVIRPAAASTGCTVLLRFSSYCAFQTLPVRGTTPPSPRLFPPTFIHPPRPCARLANNDRVGGAVKAGAQFIDQTANQVGAPCGQLRCWGPGSGHAAAEHLHSSAVTAPCHQCWEHSPFQLSRASSATACLLASFRRSARSHPGTPTHAHTPLAAPLLPRPSL